MDIPLNAQVECTDGACGRSEYVLINPVINQVTHLVVKTDLSPNLEYIVPVSKVSETKDDTIRLTCTKAELEKMDPFIKTTVIDNKVPDRIYANEAGNINGINDMGPFYYWPYVVPMVTVQVSVNHQQIPVGELAVQRGTRVEATDGFVGKVDEFVLTPQGGQITDLVMREGHLWGKKDVIIPISAMVETRGDTVFLNLDKHQVESLPVFPLQRQWS